MELSKNFEPAAIEEKWYQHWKEKDISTAQPDERQALYRCDPPA